VVPGGGLSPDGTRWISSRVHFFLPVRVLSRVFRGKFVAGLREAFQRNELTFHGARRPLADEKAFAAWLRILFRQDWVVYAKPRLVDPSTFCNTWHATPIASRSRIIACFPSMITK
jgi:hypothetical protein